MDEGEACAHFAANNAVGLRVKDKWLADRSRIFREMESLIDTASILPDGGFPEVL